MQALIIAGRSGSGKSTLANNLARLVPGAIVCEADSYFINPATGEYNFDANLLTAAHRYCQSRFETALKNKAPLVICSNTNTTAKERKFYVDKARELGYSVSVVVTERFMETNSVHDVLPTTLERQVNNLRNSIQF